jgi:hypothetical protein
VTAYMHHRPFVDGDWIGMGIVVGTVLLVMAWAIWRERRLRRGKGW